MSEEEIKDLYKGWDKHDDRIAELRKKVDGNYDYIMDYINELKEHIKIYSNTQSKTINTQGKLIDQLNELKEHQENQYEEIEKHILEMDTIKEVLRELISFHEYDEFDRPNRISELLEKLDVGKTEKKLKLYPQKFDETFKNAIKASGSENPTLGDGLPVDARYPATDSKLPKHKWCDTCEDRISCSFYTAGEKCTKLPELKCPICNSKIELATELNCSTCESELFLKDILIKFPEPSPCCKNCIKKGHTLDYCHLYYRRCPYNERVRDATRNEPRENDWEREQTISKHWIQRINTLKEKLISEFVEDLKEININDGEEPYDLVLLKKKWEKKLK